MISSTARPPPHRPDHEQHPPQETNTTHDQICITDNPHPHRGQRASDHKLNRSLVRVRLSCSTVSIDVLR
ncbi:hypothetical protein HMPREF1317_1868 [Schaalia georgiae F0490]|uniref:Uncharacterized protein n=1 Tax=Schaalia georgiae F0490 TaxID=1125717 RepID=J0N7A5_9ACTO|nr:hypothetical protein HMPREF1317_1868 [Schaalia georgiae F0490]